MPHQICAAYVSSKDIEDKPLPPVKVVIDIRFVLLAAISGSRGTSDVNVCICRGGAPRFLRSRHFVGTLYFAGWIGDVKSSCVTGLCYLICCIVCGTVLCSAVCTVLTDCLSVLLFSESHP